MGLSQKNLRRSMREAMNDHISTTSRIQNSMVPSHMNWSGFCRNLGIGIGDLDDIAISLGYVDADELDSILPPKFLLVKQPDELKEYLDAIRKVSESAYEMSDIQIISILRNT